MMGDGGGEGKDKRTENIKHKWYGTIRKTLNNVLHVFHICIASYSKILYKFIKYLQIRCTYRRMFKLILSLLLIRWRHWHRYSTEAESLFLEFVFPFLGDSLAVWLHWNLTCSVNPPSVSKVFWDLILGEKTGLICWWIAVRVCFLRMSKNLWSRCIRWFWNILGNSLFPFFLIIIIFHFHLIQSPQHASQGHGNLGSERTTGDCVI